MKAARTTRKKTGRAQIVSDLHLERYGHEAPEDGSFEPDESRDLLILAGDIGTGLGAYEATRADTDQGDNVPHRMSAHAHSTNRKRDQNVETHTGDGTNSTREAEVRRLPFTASPNMVAHLIENQAGSIEKAVLELVMNACDSGAEHVEVRIAALDRIVVEDDGRGFGSEDQIEKEFGVFGRDNAACDSHARTYGRFGLGRGQILGFAAASWHSGAFRFGADIRTEGYTFTIEEANTRRQGTRVEANLYEQLSHVQALAIARAIRSALRYVETEVRVDGTQVSTPAAEAQWSHRTPELLFRLQPNSMTGVDVYNQGVFVRTYTHYEMGVSGTLCSRRGHAFALNTARNDVLQHKCALWREARKLLGPLAAKRRASGRLNDGDRIAIIGELIAEAARDAESAASGRSEPDTGIMGPRMRTLRAKGVLTDSRSTQRLFRNVDGHTMSARMLAAHAGGRIGIAPERGDAIAATVHRSRHVAILGPETAEWLEARGASEAAERLNAMFRHCRFHVGEPFSGIEYHELASAYEGTCTLIDASEWTPTERAALAALQELSAAVEYAMVTMGTVTRGEGKAVRRICLGRADAAEGWSDGATYIAFERSLVARALKAGARGWETLCHRMVRHYASGADSSQGPEAGREHDAAIVDTLLHERWAGHEHVAKALRAYDKARAAAGLSRTTDLARALDHTRTEETVH